MRFIIPDSNGVPEGLAEAAEKSATTPIHSDKWHRCIGHVQDANAKRGTSYSPHGVCTSSIGYAGSVNPDHRRKPRGYQSPPIAGRSKGPGIRRAREAQIRENQKKLAAKYGITEFDFPHPESTIKHIGFSPTRKQWYGWSHRAVGGFGVGSRVKKGDMIAINEFNDPRQEIFPVGFEAKTLTDAKRMAAAFALSVS